MAWLPRSPLAPISFAKFAMCSSEKVGWPGEYRDLGLPIRDLGIRAENFPISTGQPGYPDEKISNTRAFLPKEDKISISYFNLIFSDFRNVSRCRMT